jgi:3-methyl-2-oxobutanoate hydroxymethyltransferase
MKNASPRKLTVPDISSLKGKRPIVMITAYDHSMARLLDDAGTDMVLTGDSYAMVGLGLPDTLGAEMADMITITAAVSRACRRALVVADMPFLSYQTDIRTARMNAGLLVKKGRADAVKIEAGRLHDIGTIVQAVVETEIPVMGHIGLTPQSVKRMGGFRIQGRNSSEALRILEQAKILEKAGAFSIVLEGIPAELGRLITAEISIPTIGIGAGPHCDGQVQVLQDLLGLTEHLPRHAKAYASLAPVIRNAVERFGRDVRKRTFPGKDQTVRMTPQESAKLGQEIKHENHGKSGRNRKNPSIPIL